jgi:hypothetical protein
VDEITATAMALFEKTLIARAEAEQGLQQLSREVYLGSKKGAILLCLLIS